MINVTEKDLGKFVIYCDHAPVPTIEAGVIVGFNERTVFVSFPKKFIREEATTQGCTRESLYWIKDVVKIPNEDFSVRPPEKGG